MKISWNQLALSVVFLILLLLKRDDLAFPVVVIFIVVYLGFMAKALYDVVKRRSDSD